MIQFPLYLIVAILTVVIGIYFGGELTTLDYVYLAVLALGSIYVIFKGKQK